MNQIQAVDVHAKLDKKQAAFVIFYALDGKPWANYPEDNSGRQGLAIPVCLMINRADGDAGFIGGRVEEGETLEEAATREVQEEIGYTIQGMLEPIVAHDIGPITTHAFAVQVGYEEIRKIQDDAFHADHFGAEITGAFLPHLIDYDTAVGKGAGIQKVIASSLAPSVREELVHFLLKKNILSKDELAKICQKAGCDLDSLLE